MLRYCYPHILANLSESMVFIGGPRQVGKTALTQFLCEKDYPQGEHLGWDFNQERRRILKKQWKIVSPLIIFNELHKYPKWKQWIKGVYDSRPTHQQYLVANSSCFENNQNDDDFTNQYYYWRLHPFTLDELPETLSAEIAYERLLNVGGFPEPFLSGDIHKAKEWRKERLKKIVREDIQDIEPVRQILLLELFVDAFRGRVGNNVALAQIAQELGVSPKTTKAWLTLLERMCVVFSLYPFKRDIARSILKPPKVYFYDNADVESEGARLENLVATHLLKRLHFIEDYHGYRCELRYIRDKEGREVDFVTLIDNKAIDLIDVRQSGTEISPHLKYYAKKLNPKRVVQIVGDLKEGFDQDGVSVRHPIEFFQNPPWSE